MAKKSEKSKSNRKAAAKPTDVQTKKNLQFRVRSLKDLQVTKDKKKEKDKEMEENAGSDCEVIEMGEGGIKGSIKRKSSVDTIERESVSEPKIVKTEAAASLKSATRPFVASQRRGRDPAASLSSVQVLGVDLLFRHHSSTILFKTDSVLELLGKSLPLAPHSLRSVVGSDSNSSACSAVQHVAADENSAQETLRRSFISWKSLRAVLDSGLLDLAIRDTLLASKESLDTVPTIAGDTVVFNSTETKFKVRGGTVYLDVLSAFTILDRLHDALNGTWATVDSLLAARGLSQKEAFKKRGSASGRSYMTLEAFMIVAEEGGASAQKEAQAMKEQVEQLIKKKDALCRELEQTVEMIIRTSCITPREGRERKEPRLGHRSCSNNGCGRGYHFVLQCCSTAHTLRLGEVDVGCIRKEGKLYLEKCAAFGALGRMFVIRCSDYRRVDRILDAATEDGKETVEQSFLFEQDETCRGRNRRTHISLDAFTILVNGGFADPTKMDSLHQSLAKVVSEGLPLCCELGEDMIDLSESDAEKEVKQEEIDSEAAIESPPSRRRISSDTLSTSEDDTLTEHEDFCSLLGHKVPFRLAKDQVYLGKAKVLALINTPSPVYKSKKALDALLEAHGVSLDEAFCYEGRHRGYISTTALKIILNSELMSKFAERERLLEAISEIESSAGSLGENLTLPLNAFSSELRFRSLGGAIYLDLNKLVRTAALFPEVQPSKTNMYISKILADRGVDVEACFLRQGKTKFAFIRLDAAITLLRCDNCAGERFGNQEGLIANILEALKERGIQGEKSILDKGIKICPSFAPIQYKLIDGCLYLHRKSCFEILNLESALLATKKGYGAINSILSMAGLEPSSCYQSSRNQKYGYISCLALLRILESKEPLIVCLPIKDRFFHGLLERLQNGAVEELQNSLLEVGGGRIEVVARDGILFLNRQQALVLAGLDAGEALAEFEDPTSALEERGLRRDGCFMQKGEDRLGWISLIALLVLISLETEVGEGREGSVAWRDLLSAVAMQEPRLRQQIAVDSFRHSLLTAVLSLYTKKLARESEPSLLLTESSENEASDSDGTSQVRALRVLSTSSDHVVPSASCPPSPAASLGLHSPIPSCLPSPTGSSCEVSLEANQPSLTMARYQQMKTDVLNAGGGLGGSIGDWEVVGSSPLTLRVRPGYGASRKLSFLRPDFAAILSYNLVLGPQHVSLTINDSSIPSHVLTTLLEREEREGTLSFLYQLISLRPCFGCFSPELVETVRQWDDETAAAEKVFIDSSFIGSSGSGRTYAGTVRSQDCGLIAFDRVSDCCQPCRQLAKLTINRSLFGEENKGEKKNVKGEQASQKSVWQLATTTEDRCSFVALQLQSFNTSLPHAFNSASQATAVVEHRAEISNSLQVEVHLSGRRVSRKFPDFQRDRQLGPMLDWVAGLRLCVGYPAYQLVSQANYLQTHMSRLRPDLQKLFSMLTVDSKFSYSEGEGEEMMWGTIRSGNCQTAAEQGADICHQCRLLQEPVEFLTIS